MKQKPASKYLKVLVEERKLTLKIIAMMLDWNKYQKQIAAINAQIGRANHGTLKDAVDLANVMLLTYRDQK